MNRTRKDLTPRVAVIAAAVLFGAASARAATGGDPLTMVHTGFLLDGSDHPVTATGVLMKFRIFDAQGFGNIVWEGTCGAVDVLNGYYAVVLGSAACVGTTSDGLDPALDTSDLPTTDVRWLELEVAGTTLLPRMSIATVPTAAVARRALTTDRLGEHVAADFALTANLSTVAASGAYADLTGTPALATVATTGSYSDLTSRPALVAVATTGAYSDLTGSPIGTLTAGQWCVESNGKISCTASPPVAAEVDPKVGANATNYVPKWSGTALVSTSALFEDASGHVGVGVSNPGQKLDVAGNVNVGSQAARTTAATNRGQLAQSSTFTQTLNANGIVDWNNGNLQEVATFACDGAKTLTMANLRDGAAYSLLLSGAAAHSGKCLLAASGFTFKTSGGASTPLASKDVLITFAVIGATVVYSMVDGLQ